MKKLFLGLVLVGQVYCADKPEGEINYADLFCGFQAMEITDSSKKPIDEGLDGFSISRKKLGTEPAKSAVLCVKKSVPGSIGKKPKGQAVITEFFKRSKKRRNAKLIPTPEQYRAAGVEPSVESIKVHAALADQKARDAVAKEAAELAKVLSFDLRLDDK